MTTVSVSPTNKNPSHMIKLSAGGTDIGLRPIKEAEGIHEIPYSPSSMKVTSGGGAYSDFELPYSHISQDSWDGGRAQETYYDESRFYDSYAMWTSRTGQATLAPQWALGSGHRTAQQVLWTGIDMQWFPLYDAAAAADGRQYISQYFTASSTISGTEFYVWIRRVGTPGTLTARLYDDSDTDAGAPDMDDPISDAATVTTSTITDTVSRWYKFSLTASITSAADYVFVVSGADTDTSTNHWEIGCYHVDSSANYQTWDGEVGTDWANGTHRFFFRFTADSSALAEWGFFRYKEGMYTYRNTGGDDAPGLYIIGDRGCADASAATTLVDASKSWTADAWIGATVKIFKGTGQGQYRAITDNDATSLTVSTWGVTPDTTSEYVIVGTYRTSTTTIGTHGLTKPIKDVCPAGQVCFFAMGDKAKMRGLYIYNDSGFQATYTDHGASTSVYADFLHAMADQDPSVGLKLWRIINTSGTTKISSATATADATALETTSFTDAGTLEPFEFPTNLLDYDGKLYAFTHKNAYQIINNLATKLGLGLNAMPSWHNGIAAAVHNLYLYFGWSHSMERLYGSTLDDIGPWGDSGLPSGRTGYVSCILPVVGWLIVAIDGGTAGTSSVMVWNGMGWHEIFRGWEAGRRITQLQWEPVEGDRGKLWGNCGDDIWFIEFPLDTLNPVNDDALLYTHEGHIITSWMDAGFAELPKYFKEVSVRADGLDTTNYIDVDYQTDNSGDSSAWTNAGKADASPQETVSIGVGDKKRIRLRLKFITASYASTPKLVATVLKCFARMPVKYQYNVTFDVGHNKRTYNGLPDHDPDTLLNQLESWAESATPLTMRCVLERLDNKTVIVEPPNVLRKTWNKVQSWFGGVATVVIRET